MTNQARPQVFFDLTELFTASSRFKYYGIARVVAELALALSQIKSGVRYVVFSPAKAAFFEVQPKFEDDASGFVIDLGIDASARPIRIRQTYHSPHWAIKPALWLFKITIRTVDKLRWARLDCEPQTVDLNGATFIAAGRPKIIVEYLADLERFSPTCNFIVLLHDMIPIHYAKDIREIEQQRRFDRNFYYDNCAILRRANRVLTNSEFTKTDIERLHGIGILPTLPPVSAVPLAHECRGSKEPIARALPAPGYFLCVGSTVGRKNLEVVLEAMRLIAEGAGEVPRLVLAGTARKRIVKYLEDKMYDPIRSKVTFYPNPNQAELVALYKGAKALIMPSKLEGWGLPSGEAMWCGTSVICADIPVLHEVCGSRSTYFPPDDFDCLSALLMKELPPTEQDRNSLTTWQQTGLSVMASSILCVNEVN